MPAYADLCFLFRRSEARQLIDRIKAEVVARGPGAFATTRPDPAAPSSEGQRRYLASLGYEGPPPATRCGLIFGGFRVRVLSGFQDLGVRRRACGSARLDACCLNGRRLTLAPGSYCPS